MAGILPLRADLPVLLLIWVIVTAYNLFKPFHIDDTAHLEIARHILADPLHPMSGILNWVGVDEPIHRTNQPHLFFFLLALWASVFGFEEPALHAFQSLFALACILLFHRLARRFAGPNALWATAVLILGPAFIIEQNLMVDVPLLALWLAFFNLLVLATDHPRQTRRYLLAGFACGAALLVKYSSLILYPILCISLLIERRWKQAWTAMIPVLVLVGWSLFNLWDYGGVHILARPVPAGEGLSWRFGIALSWLVTLGALTPLGVIALVRSRARERIHYWLTGGLFVALALLVAVGAVSDGLSDRILLLAFAASGATVGAALVPNARMLVGRLFKKREGPDLLPHLYLYLWILGATAFYIRFTPFVAARHVLLILPPVTLLLAAEWRDSLSRSAKSFGLAATLVVSSGLCLSDWRFADFFRSQAAEFARLLPPGGRGWASGHWGWQWYAAKAGFAQVDMNRSSLRTGDVLAVGDTADPQPLDPPAKLRLLRSAIQNEPLLSLVCTGRAARFYYIPAPGVGPWSLSRDCLNQASLYRIEADRPGVTEFLPVQR